MLHTALRKALKQQDIDNKYLGKLLGRSVVCISQRLNAKQPWTLDEAYEILEALSLPYEKLHVLFPPGGKDWLIKDNPAVNEEDWKKALGSLGDMLKRVASM